MSACQDFCCNNITVISLLDERTGRGFPLWRIVTILSVMLFLYKLKTFFFVFFFLLLLFSLFFFSSQLYYFICLFSNFIVASNFKFLNLSFVSSSKAVSGNEHRWSQVSSTMLTKYVYVYMNREIIQVKL